VGVRGPARGLRAQPGVLAGHPRRALPRLARSRGRGRARLELATRGAGAGRGDRGRGCTASTHPTRTPISRPSCARIAARCTWRGAISTRTWTRSPSSSGATSPGARRSLSIWSR
jgi:hypothetical protein